MFFTRPSQKCIMPEIYKLKEKGQSFILLPCRRVDYAGRINHKTGRKRVSGRFWSKYAHGQQERPLTLPNWRPWGFLRIPTTVMTANGEVQTREKATVYVRELDLFVTVMLLEETPAVLSLGKLCADHVYTHHWTSGQDPHLTGNGGGIDCGVSGSLVCQRVPLLHLHLLRQHLHRRILWPARKIQQQKEVKLWVRSHGETRRVDQQKPKTQMKMKTTKKYDANYCKMCRNGCRISRRIWWIRMNYQYRVFRWLRLSNAWSGPLE